MWTSLPFALSKSGETEKGCGKPQDAGGNSDPIRPSTGTLQGELFGQFGGDVHAVLQPG